MRSDSRSHEQMSSPNTQGARSQNQATCLRDIISRKLTQRIDDIRNESDTNGTGARTILRWLETDLACFNTGVELISNVDANVAEDKVLNYVDEVLLQLYRESKEILTIGKLTGQQSTSSIDMLAWAEVLNAEELRTYACDDLLSEASRQEMTERFGKVSDLVRQAVQNLLEHNWEGPIGGNK